MPGWPDFACSTASIASVLIVLIASRIRPPRSRRAMPPAPRSEEHTSELQSRPHLVCRLLLEKKKKKRGEAQNRKTPRESDCRETEARGYKMYVLKPELNQHLDREQDTPRVEIKHRQPEQPHV